MRYHRKIIRLKAEDSPNVKLALEEQAAGKEPSGREVVPGVIDWDTYQYRRMTWDKIRQCISLDGEFYEGAELLMFPPDWLNLSEQCAERLPSHRPGEAIGVDTAEGGDKTCWAVIDSKGLIKLTAMHTMDTNVIPGVTIALMNEYGVSEGNVLFDQGGGGHEHVDRLKGMGYDVQMVAFGESPTPEPSYYAKPWMEKQYEKQGRLSYKNRRAQMYWELRMMLQPRDDSEDVFAIPRQYTELRRQMAPIPVRYTEEGKIMLLHKRPRDSKDTRENLMDLLGCSPDETDALALAVHALTLDNVYKVDASYFW